MARAREQLIDLSATSYYHCISRCVRRAYLCGEDSISHQSFEHRRQWLVDRFKLLSTVFAIDICAYAVMSNHYHLVLRVNKDLAISWTDEEVIKRWRQLCRGHILVDRYMAGQLKTESEREAALKIVSSWRQRLFDISWYMRHLNEYIARQANKEDGCTGRFWEGRFQSQALLDDTALLSCMAYVELNPVRAAVADDLELSDFTSIQERIKALKVSENDDVTNNTPDPYRALKQPKALLPFECPLTKNTLPFNLMDYLELVDWSGRILRDDKAGAISPDNPKILDVIALERDEWVSYIQNFRRMFSNFAGRASSLYLCAQQHDHRWYKGVGD